MRHNSWNLLKETVGEGLCLFTVFMSFMKTSEIMEGLSKSMKGFDLLTDQTVTFMEQDIMAGMCRETLLSKFDQLPMDAEKMDTELFVTGLNDLMATLDKNGEANMDPYFDYICEWDLAGHDWNRESPLSYMTYTRTRVPSMLS